MKSAASEFVGGFLILEHPENGEMIKFEGRVLRSFSGDLNKGFGELIFNTSMTGYQEVITDPSYHGQIVCFTAPHIGNTGINSVDSESSKVWCGGIVVHEFITHSSNWRSEITLGEFLHENETPLITGVDTRKLTLTIRAIGAARGLILKKEDSLNAKSYFASLPLFSSRNLISEVSTQKIYGWAKPQAPKFKVAAIDFGAKANLFRILSSLGCEINIYPSSTSAEEILAYSPNGLFLTNGPGDPMTANIAISTVKNLVGRIPIFGVCMGHQILSLALGAKTYKLKFGHHGSNHPVYDLTSKRVVISAQNHGYAVDPTSLPENVTVTHVNLNDKTVEGIEYLDKMAFSVQYHPEACPGPRESADLFQKFIYNMSLK